MRIDLGIDDVRLEVGASPRDASTLQMVVDPSQEDGLRRHLHQILETFVVKEKASQSWTAVQSDVAEQTDADDLPEETQHQMRLALGQIVGIDVHNVATDSLGGNQGQGQILKLPVDREVLLIDRPLINCVRAGVVDDFAQQNTILDAQIQSLALAVDGQQMLQILVMAQIRVDPVGEGQLLLEAHRMGGALGRDARHAAKGLQVLLLGDDGLECAGHILALQVQAQCLELLQIQFALEGGLFALALVLINHLAHLVAGQLEAHLIEGIL